MTKNQKFYRFSTFLCIFCQIFDRLRGLELKTFNMALIRCPVGFSEEIFVVFQTKENLKLTPKTTKIPKFSIFQTFKSIFVKFLKDFVDWIVLKGQQRKNVLSSRLFRRVYYSLSSENVSN